MEGKKLLGEAFISGRIINLDKASIEDLKHFNEDIDICKRYEQAICELTSSMDVTTDNIQGKQFSKNI